MTRRLPERGQSQNKTPRLIRVLVVDDHQMLAESLVRILSEDQRITVIGVAITAGDGLDRVRAEQPDIVLLDFGLPDMDGAEATRLIKAEFPGIRVIIMTGSDSPGAHAAAWEAGCDAWVRKTRAAGELRDVVRAVYLGQPVEDQELKDLPPLDQLVVHYQPIVEVDTKRIVGFEALVRWNHPGRGLIYPAAFIPHAEMTGYIWDISQYVGIQAMTQLHRWQRAFPQEPRLWLSINLSAAGLGRPEAAERIRAQVQNAPIDPSDIVLEVTETVLLEDTEANRTCLLDLRRLGVRLALDDFGTAFSSLSWLRQFPFDHIKIDHSFTVELPGATRNGLLVEAIQQLGSVLGLTPIAEGIEREEQADFLHRAGWKLGQGFMYSPGVDAEAATALLASQHP